jgi:hypothetical protein
MARSANAPQNSAGKHQLSIVPFKRSLPMPVSLEQ